MGAIDKRGLLDAPCIFCGYNGQGYWQEATHDRKCPFSHIGGISDRIKILEGLDVLIRDRNKNNA